MATAPGMLPRLIAFAAAALLVSATISLAADKTPMSHPATAPTAKQKVLVVPDVQRQVFVFAKGMLEDRGFGWQVQGSVRGFAANKVVSQSPKPGLRVLDTGAPKITLELQQMNGAKQTGTPEDRSPYGASLVRLTPAELARAKAQARKAKAAAAHRKGPHKRHSKSR